ncbi:MAG: murein L,D-transpeptidase catalytic domain family protein [Cytophagales bacterium]|nr:murein L,D-transpeptidase catalytic domain family protein [Bernardetiaceae bacterium]MDW8204609.1 murein L,D-transpeptidase catalytic domain family protein [Cytophagales bacterium]
MGLAQQGMHPEAFQKALMGYLQFRQLGKLSAKPVLSIIDFSLPSNRQRLWVIDLAKQQVLFHCLVAHGVNSGLHYAQKFSNREGSQQSSLGFYITGATYQGKHGLSLYLNGQEARFNSNARRRAIVMHGAAYVSWTHVAAMGRIGRSQGCPAVPENLAADIIHTIKEGTCLYIYHPSREYHRFSKWGRMMQWDYQWLAFLPFAI